MKKFKDLFVQKIDEVSNISVKVNIFLQFYTRVLMILHKCTLVLFIIQDMSELLTSYKLFINMLKFI